MTITQNRRETLQKAGIKAGNAPKHRYTEEERDFIRTNYNGTYLSAQFIAERLGVTPFGVKGQVQRMGLAMQKSRPWTDKELKELGELVHRYSIHEIAKKLRRSLNAVKIKATRLGMKLRIHYGWFTKKDCCEILGVDHHKAQEWIDNGLLKATWHSGRKPQARGMAMWHVEINELRRFIIENAEILQGRNVDIQQIVGILAAVEPESLPVVVPAPALKREVSGPCPKCGGRVVRDSLIERDGVVCFACGFRPRPLATLAYTGVKD